MVPSWQQASGPASRGSWACCAITPSKARTYSRARRINRASDTHLPSSENTRTPAAGSGHQPQFRQLRTLQALADRTDWHYLSEAIASTEFGHVLGGLCRVGDRCGVRHGQDRRIAAPGGGRRAACHRFGVLAARLAEMTVQVDQAWQGDQPFGIESLDVRPGLGRIGQDAVRAAAGLRGRCRRIPRR